MKRYQKGGKNKDDIHIDKEISNGCINPGSAYNFLVDGWKANVHLEQESYSGRLRRGAEMKSELGSRIPICVCVL